MQSSGIDLDRIEELLDGQTIRYSSYIATQCIFHDDTRPSLLIYEDYYHCLGCGVRGKSLSLLDKLSGNSNLTPHKKPDFFGNPFTEWCKNQTLPQVLKTSWENLMRNPSVYLRGRGISNEDQIKYGLGLRDGWITFPIRDTNNKIVGAVARAQNGQKSKYITPAGQDSNLLYVPNISRWLDSRYFYITFGIIDALTLALYDLPVVSTTNGKRIDPHSLDMHRKQMLFIPDRGEEREAVEIAAKLGWRGKVIDVNWPDDCKDISDVHMKHGEMLIKREGKRWL